MLNRPVARLPLFEKESIRNHRHKKEVRPLSIPGNPNSTRLKKRKVLRYTATLTRASSTPGARLYPNVTPPAAAKGTHAIGKVQ